MRKLTLALYPEGTTDERFLSQIIQRTVEEKFKQNEKDIIDITIRIVMKDGSITKRDEAIFQAARSASNCDVLIIHCDADASTRERAMNERFLPGQALVAQTTEQICKSLLPIIPVRMTEAWMLATEHDLLRTAMRTTLSAQTLGLVNKVKQVEADPDPKKTIKQIVQKAYADHPRRRREADLGGLYALLARQIGLDRLSNVPSYKQFVADLTEMLKHLNFL